MIIPCLNPSWKIVVFFSTDVTTTPFSRKIGGSEKIEIKERPTTAIKSQILKVIFAITLELGIL